MNVFGESNYRIVFGLADDDKNIGNESKDAFKNGDKKLDIVYFVPSDTVDGVLNPC